MRRALPLVFVLGLFVPFSLLLLAASAQAAFPGQNGKIVFQESTDTWVTDGPRATPLRLDWRDANFQRGSVYVETPEVAPDGERALVTVETTDERRPKAERGQFLGLISLDGAVQTRLLSWPSEWGRLGPATFFPGGRRIAFTVYHAPHRSPPASIFVMDVDGTDVERLADGAEPAVSPDGNRIAFHSTRDGNTKIYSMGTDGTGAERLRRGADPDFSPDGERILFEGHLPATDPDCYPDPTIALMNSDGSDVRHLRRGYSCDFGWHGFESPGFSPNGRKIVFVDQSFNVRGSQSVKVMNRDGSNEVRLPPVEDGSDPWYFNADWGPEATGGPSGRCADKRVTIAGTGLADRIRGTNGSDVIQARRGDDVVVGRGGRDHLCGGPGDDVLRGGPGPDVLIGGKGFDRCFGGKGQDTVRCERVESA